MQLGNVKEARRGFLLPGSLYNGDLPRGRPWGKSGSDMGSRGVSARLMQEPGSSLP